MSVAAELLPESRTLDVGGVEIAYREVGWGKPLVLLHGAGPGASGWSNFRATVPTFQADHRVIVPDLPRFGGSSKVAIAGPRLTALSGIMAGFLDGLGVERAHLLGNSLGGQVAMKIGIDRPDLVDRIVVMGSPPLRTSAMVPMPAEGIRLIEGYYRDEGPTRGKMRQLLQSLVFDARYVTDELVEERYQASIDPAVLAMMAGPKWERETLDGQLELLAAPVLVVWGQDDRAAPLDIALRMARELPDARLTVFPRCGHWAQVERADEFNAVTRLFLAGGT